MCTNQDLVTTGTIKTKPRLGVRHLQTFMMFLALVISYGMRANISMAVVAMTDKHSDQSFEWSIQTQSVILSSFFWGYVILQVPAGEVAARVGGTVLIAVSVAVNSAVSLITPVAANYGGWQATCACRVIIGLFQGFLWPSIHHLIGKWIPLDERSSLGTYIYAGAQLGTALQLLVSGYITHYWGWPAIFYSDAVLGIAWLLVYLFLGADTPRQSKMISDEELLYIESNMGHDSSKKTRNVKTPWFAIMTSMPFVSVIIAHSVQAWGFWTIMMEMPSYLDKVLGVNIKSNGLMSAIPYLTMYILSFPVGIFADYLINKKYLSVTATRKLSNSIGHFGAAIVLIGLTYAPAGNVTAAVILFTVVVGINVGHLTGFMLVHIEMAPNFAGTLMGITNCVGNTISIMAPLTAGALLKDETDPGEWRKVFYLVAALYVIGNTLFLIFGTSELQPWNDLRSDDDKRNDANSSSTETNKEV